MQRTQLTDAGVIQTVASDSFVHHLLFNHVKFQRQHIYKFVLEAMLFLNILIDLIKWIEPMWRMSNL